MLSLRPYGAFLDLGDGVVGLLHVSQITQERVRSVETLLSVGDRVKVGGGGGGVVVPRRSRLWDSPQARY